MTRSLATGALLTQMLFSGGCGFCHSHVHTFTLDDAQVARATEGTAAPTHTRLQRRLLRSLAAQGRWHQGWRSPGDLADHSPWLHAL